jgi:hypothetical protein
MRTLLLLALVALLAAPAAGFDLGRRLPAKPAVVARPPAPVDQRQGGDTVADAVAIPSLPFHETGTTAGYVNDYDVNCPYTFAAAPDVVYSFHVPSPTTITIDLCGSSYDTKVWVWSADFVELGCNDDYYYDDVCGHYTSYLPHVPVAGDIYVVVDGYMYEAGTYILDIVDDGIEPPCVLTCPPGGVAEGEPPLHDGYDDDWNGGCGSHPVEVFQPVTGNQAGEAILCGVSGWYVNVGVSYRDTDWFSLLPGPGALTVTADAEQPTQFFDLGPTDCAAVEILQAATAGDCAPASLTLQSTPGQAKWFWVGPTVFAAPPGAEATYEYIVWFSGLEPGVATSAATWGAVKSLYR